MGCVPKEKTKMSGTPKGGYWEFKYNISTTSPTAMGEIRQYNYKPNCTIAKIRHCNPKIIQLLIGLLAANLQLIKINHRS